MIWVNKLTVNIKSTNNNRSINGLIANKLIQDLFSYLFYLNLISEFC